MQLQRYILRRLGQTLPVALVVIVINFTLIHAAPGDVSIILAGENTSPQYLEAIRAQYGLDQPLYVQLLRYLGQVLSGDLGKSYLSGEPVAQLILERMPATLLLTGISLVLAAVVGTLIGTYIARRPGSALDAGVTGVAISISSIPVFWLGLMLILLFAIDLRWLPSSGMVTIGHHAGGIQHALDVARHLVLPVTALSTLLAGQFIRLARASVADALSETYVITARAIGYSERRVTLSFGLRNGILPIVTIFGLEMGGILAGSALTETVFSWPGLGRLIYEAILARDTPVIMGAFIFISFSVMVAALITDIVYAALDPRVRL